MNTAVTLLLFNGLFSRTTSVSQYQKGKASLDLNEARDDGVLGYSGISCTIFKQSAPRSGEITTQTPHHSTFTGRMLFLTPNQQCQSTEWHTRCMCIWCNCYVCDKVDPCRFGPPCSSHQILATPLFSKDHFAEQIICHISIHVLVKASSKSVVKFFGHIRLVLKVVRCTRKSHIVCRAGRVYVMLQCPSVCLSQLGPQQQTGGCRFAVLGPAGRRYRSIVPRWSACIGSWTQTR